MRFLRALIAYVFLVCSFSGSYAQNVSPVSVIGNNNGVASGQNGKILVRNARITLPSRVSYQQVMASPPTPVLTTTDQISSSRKWGMITGVAASPLAASPFSVTGAGSPVLHGTTFPDWLYVSYQSVNYGSIIGRQFNFARYSFMHDGRYLEFYIKGTASSINVKVNDQYLSLTPTAISNDGQLYFWYIDFGSVAKRRIDFLTTGFFGGVYTGANDSVEAAPIRGPLTIIEGDSLTEGTGATAITGYVPAFADAIGWDNVWASGVGGTGYVNTGGGGKVACGTRAPTDIVAYNPEFVVLTCGHNDTASDYATIYAAAYGEFSYLASALPNATILATSPIWNAGGAATSTGVITTRNAIRDAASSAGILFIDFMQMPLPAGFTPQVAALNSQANAGATTLSITGSIPLVIGATYQFADGTYFVAKSETGLNPVTVTTDNPIQSTEAASAALTLVGNSFISGSGNTASPAAWGNASLYVGSDGTHYTVQGYEALGQNLAYGVMNALAPN